MIDKATTSSIKSTSAWRAFNRKYGVDEPNGLLPERSIVWQTILTELWKEGVTKSHIAARLSIPSDEMENLLFGLTGDVKPPDRAQGRPALRTA